MNVRKIIIVALISGSFLNLAYGKKYSDGGEGLSPIEAVSKFYPEAIHLVMLEGVSYRPVKRIIAKHKDGSIWEYRYYKVGFHRLTGHAIEPRLLFPAPASG